MRRKEALFAVIGGIVGAVLVMATGLFSPLGAQNEVEDLNAGKIFCTGLAVLNEKGELCVWLSTADDGGRVGVYDKNGKTGVAMGAGEGGGAITVGDKDGKMDVAISVGEHGGRVDVFGKDGEAGGAMALMSVGEHGGAVNVFGKDGGSAILEGHEDGGRVRVRAKFGKGNAGIFADGFGGRISVVGNDNQGSAIMSVDSSLGDGGVVGVYDKDGGIRAGMGLNEYGGGAVRTWDKNGDDSATLE